MVYTFRLDETLGFTVDESMTVVSIEAGSQAAQIWHTDAEYCESYSPPIQLNWRVTTVNGKFIETINEIEKYRDQNLDHLDIGFAWDASTAEVAPGGHSRSVRSSKWSETWEPYQSETFEKHVVDATKNKSPSVMDGEVPIESYGRWRKWYSRMRRKVYFTYDDIEVPDGTMGLIPFSDISTNTALILAIRCGEEEIAMRLIKRNRVHRCTLRDSDGKEYQRLTEYLTKHESRVI